MNKKFIACHQYFPLKIWLSSALWSIGAIAIASNRVLAQLIPDQTLGNNNSRVIGNLEIKNLPSDRIDGGLISGTNLFHSFQEFNVGAGRGVYFSNPSGIDNILTRVTGPSASQILGTLGVLGNANLFLINPNGITFGTQAKLDVNRSFIGTTASSIKLSDGSFFSAVNPQTPTLLTMNVPVGLQFGTKAGEILVQGTGHNVLINDDLTVDSRNRNVGLQVPFGQTLALVGGQVTLVGGNLTAQSGRVELGSVQGENLVNIDIDIASNYTFNYPDLINFGNIQLSKQSSIDTRGAGGGNIRVQGGRVEIIDSYLRADTLGTLPGGDLLVNASRSLDIIGTTSVIGFDRTIGLFAEVERGATGNAGQLLINTPEFRLEGGGLVSVATRGSGNGGSLTINAPNSVRIIGRNPNDINIKLFTGLLSIVENGATGAGGNLTIETKQLIGEDTARIQVIASAQALGNGGRARINTEQLQLLNGAQISASTFSRQRANGGTLEINATESVEIIGVANNVSSGLFAQVNANATGNGGDLRIETKQLSVQNGGTIAVGTLANSRGRGGTLDINATDAIEISGTATTATNTTIFSSLRARSEGTGDAGDLKIRTGQLVVKDRGLITASSTSTGRGGNVDINARSLIVNDGGSVAATATGSGSAGNLLINSQLLTVNNNGSITATATGSGSAGNIIINAARSAQINNSGSITATATGTGSAGDINIEAGQLFLNNAGSITATAAAGDRGNIRLKSDTVQLRQQSKISTNASGTATGGNIAINADTLVALENSDITANAQQSFGGRVIINTQGIFGTQFRLQTTPESDITATSDLGLEFSGSVQIQTPGVDPNQGLVQLPETVVNASGLIEQSCASAQGNRFVVTGRGGLPPNPSDPLSDETVWVDLGESSTLRSQRSSVNGQQSTIAQERGNNPQTNNISLVEAQGVAIGADGNLVLTTQPQNASIHDLWWQPVACANIKK